MFGNLTYNAELLSFLYRVINTLSEQHHLVFEIIYDDVNATDGCEISRRPCSQRPVIYT